MWSAPTDPQLHKEWQKTKRHLQLHVPKIKDIRFHRDYATNRWRACANMVRFIVRCKRQMRQPLQPLERRKAMELYFAACCADETSPRGEGGAGKGGSITSMQQVRDLFFSIGQLVDDEELNDLYLRVGCTQGHTVSINLFLEMLSLRKRRWKRESNHTDTEAAFLSLMDPESRDIAINDMLKLCTDYQLSDEVNRVIAETDADGSGRIDFGEFSELLQSSDPPIDIDGCGGHDDDDGDTAAAAAAALAAAESLALGGSMRGASGSDPGGNSEGPPGKSTNRQGDSTAAGDSDNENDAADPAATTAAPLAVTGRTKSVLGASFIRHSGKGATSKESCDGGPAKGGSSSGGGQKSKSRRDKERARKEAQAQKQLEEELKNMQIDEAAMKAAQEEQQRRRQARHEHLVELSTSFYPKELKHPTAETSAFGSSGSRFEYDPKIQKLPELPKTPRRTAGREDRTSPRVGSDKDGASARRRQQRLLLTASSASAFDGSGKSTTSSSWTSFNPFGCDADDTAKPLPPTRPASHQNSSRRRRV